MIEEKEKQLVALIRRLAREVVWEAVDKHVEQYEHKKVAQDHEAKNQ